MVGSAEGGTGGGEFVGCGCEGGVGWGIGGREVFDAPEEDGGFVGAFGEDEVGVELDAVGGKGWISRKRGIERRRVGERHVPVYDVRVNGTGGKVRVMDYGWFVRACCFVG